MRRPLLRPAKGRIAILILGIAFTACAPVTRPNPFEFHLGRNRPALLEVRNQNWSDMVVYLSRGSARQRLGSVTSQNEATFQLNPSIIATAASLQFVAAPIGSDRVYTSLPIIVGPGDRIVWRLRERLEQSELFKR